MDRYPGSADTNVKNGREYGIKECTQPSRTVTSTVPVAGGAGEKGSCQNGAGDPKGTDTQMHGGNPSDRGAGTGEDRRCPDPACGRDRC